MSYRQIFGIERESLPLAVRSVDRRFDPWTFTIILHVFSWVMALWFLVGDGQSRVASFWIGRLGLNGVPMAIICGIESLVVVLALRGALWLRCYVMFSSSFFWLFMGMDVLRGAFVHHNFSVFGVWDLFLWLCCLHACNRWARLEEWNDGN